MNNSDRFFIEDYKEVTKSINEGRTLLIPGTNYSHYLAAKVLAIEMKSYSYEVYQKEKGRLFHYGFAIPK